jgi:hypothetical protein
MDVSSSRLDHEPRTAQYFPGFGVRMPFIASSLLFLVDRVRAEQREPEIRYALQQALQLRLVADETNQHRASLLGVSVMPSKALAAGSLSSPSTVRRYSRAFIPRRLQVQPSAVA